jgi:ankyrin repeat protein
MFEFILREASAEFIAKMLSDSDVLKVLYDDSKVIASHYTMEELLVVKCDELQQDNAELWSSYIKTHYSILSKISSTKAEATLTELRQSMQKKDRLKEQRDKLFQIAKNDDIKDKEKSLTDNKDLRDLIYEFKDEEEKTLFHHLASNPNTSRELFQVLYGKILRPTSVHTNLYGLNSPDIYGKTPFHYLVDNRRTDIVEFLLATPILIAWGPLTTKPSIDELFDLSSNSRAYYETLTLAEYAAKDPDFKNILVLNKVKLIETQKTNITPAFDKFLEANKSQTVKEGAVEVIGATVLEREAQISTVSCKM